jgi:hypothetical protein
MSNFPLFTGKYSDFSPGWYEQVGSVIILSVIINIFIPHLGVLLKYFYIECKRCYIKNSNDRTKNLTKKEFFDLFIGPDFCIDYRYTDVINSFTKDTYYIICKSNVF